MVIVGSALAFMAIGAYFAWYFVKRGQAVWRECAAKKERLATESAAAQQKSDIEKMAAE